MATITIGSTSYHSYASVAQADAYLAADFTATAWRAETDPDAKGRALISATRFLDRQQWVGTKTDEDQTTAWPRTGVDGYEDDEIPQAVIDATILLAKYLHEGLTFETSASTVSNVKRIKAGSVEQEFFYPFGLTQMRMPLPVSELLAGLLGGSSSVAAAQSFDTDGCSVSDDNYGRSVGF